MSMSNPMRPHSYAWSVVAMLWLLALLNYPDRLVFGIMKHSRRVTSPSAEAVNGSMYVAGVHGIELDGSDWGLVDI